jgi:oligopeptide transport system substrate-binding protein
MQKRSLIGICAAATCLLGLATTASAEVTFVRGDTGNPGTLDPHKGSLIEEVPILQDLFEGLLTIDADGKLAPGVATKWEASADGLVYTFHLRPDAKWSNGDPVTASDFVYSLDRFFSPAVGGRFTNYLSAIKNGPDIVAGKVPPEQLGVKAVDDHTLEIDLTQPVAYFPSLMTYVFLGPVNKAEVEKYGDKFTSPGNLIGNGPYVLDSNTPNQSIVLKKNPYYHDADKVTIDKVVYIPFEDPDACVRRFEAGEVQVCASGSRSAVPSDTLASIKQRFGSQVLIEPQLFSLYAQINLHKPQLQDARVRQALSMVIDRDFLASDVFQGLADPAYGMIPANVANYAGGTALPDWASQPILDREDKAVQLMKDAGYGPDHPLKVEFAYWIQAPGGKDLATAIADAWKPLGVEVTFNPRDAAAHFDHLSSTDDYEIALAGLISIALDDPSYHAAILTSTGTFNYAHYSNKAYDDLIAQSDRELDPAKRADLLHQAENLVIADMPTIPIAFPKAADLVSPKVQGWKPNVLGSHPTMDLTITP